MLARLPGIDDSNADKNFTSGQLPSTGMGHLCTRVHGAGLKPNIMDRFMLSNSHEVLFVN
jgi:hypothetical protein